MRNLKRVLSLALALVMVLGMMVITTSAADFTDAEEITYTEAVEVMSALGILKGYPDGSFKPEGTLNRAEAAKIIAFVCLGAEADEYLTGDIADPFDDVKAAGWAAKYVAFCKNAKIIDGVGNNKFNPTGTLTTVQFAKMLLCALGIEGTFTGSGWENNVKDAVAEVPAMDATGIKIDNTMITREEACELALAAMQYSVEPDVYEVRYTDDTKATYSKIGEFADLFEATMYCKLLANDYGMVSVDDGEDNIADNEDDVYVGMGYYVEKAPAEDTLLRENYGVWSEGSSDEFGRPGIRYTNGLTGAAEFDMFYADKALITYTAPVQAAAITKAYTGYTWATGVAASDISDNADYGVTVEVYATGKQVTDVVVIEELLGKVTKVTEAKGEAKRTVTVAGKTFETESFAKDDIVLYTVGDVSGEIESMTAVKTVTGTIESYNGTAETVTIDGVKYNYGHDFSLTAEFDDEQVFTLYSDGSIAAQGAVTEAAAAVSTDYVYVTKVQYQGWSEGTSTLLGTTGAADPAAKAEVIFADGTKAVIDLTITDTNTNPAADPAYKVDAPVADGTVTKNAALTTAAEAAINNWFAYTKAEDGTYTLSAVNAAYAFVDTDGVVLTKDAMAKLGTKYTTADTVINTVDTYYTTGTKTGFVAANLTGKVLVTYAKGSNTVAALYAVGQTPAEVPADTTIYYAVESGNAVKGGTEWTFSAKGEQVTLVIKTGTVNAGGLYTLTALTGADAGLYAVASTLSPATALVTLISGDQVAFSDGTVKVLSDKVNVYNIDETAEVAGEAKTLAVGDVIYYTEANGEIVNIWVYGVEGTVEANTRNAQTVLNNVIDGLTVSLAEGDYGALTMVNTASARNNITIAGEGNVTVESITLGTSSLFTNIAFKGIDFDGTNERGGIFITANINGLTVTDCTFVNGSKISAGGSYTVGNVLVEDNVFNQTDATGTYSPIYFSGTSTGTVKVINNIFTNSLYNAVQVNGTVNADVVVSGNVINGTVDRALRFGALSSGKTVTIVGNIISNVKEAGNELFKISSTAADCSVTFDGNTYAGNAWDPADITTVEASGVVYTTAGARA